MGPAGGMHMAGAHVAGHCMTRVHVGLHAVVHAVGALSVTHSGTPPYLDLEVVDGLALGGSTAEQSLNLNGPPHGGSADDGPGGNAAAGEGNLPALHGLHLVVVGVVTGCKIRGVWTSVLLIRL